MVYPRGAEPLKGDCVTDLSQSVTLPIPPGDEIVTLAVFAALKSNVYKGFRAIRLWK